MRTKSQATLVERRREDCVVQVRDVQGGAGAIHLPRHGHVLGGHPPPRGHQAYVPRRRQESHLFQVSIKRI